MAEQALVINPQDSVAVAVEELAAGSRCTVRVGDDPLTLEIVEKISLGNMSELALSGGAVEGARQASPFRSIVLKNDIPFGHKFALKRIAKGENVIKYGEVIGEATQDIEEGEWVHVHNVVSRRAKERVREGTNLNLKASDLFA